MDYNRLLHNISHFNILEKKESELWKAYRQHPEDKNLYLKLMELYLPIVVKTAKAVLVKIGYQCTLDDLIGAGTIGLHKAIENFVAEKKIRFSTFAYKHIRGAIIDELRKMDTLTRTQRAIYKSIVNTAEELTSQFGRYPTDRELAEKLNMSVQDMERYIAMGSDAVNLDDKFEGGLSYAEVIEDKNSVSPDAQANLNLAKETMRELFNSLDEREQKILFLRHYQDLSVKEVAKVMKISEGRISQIYKKAILKLRTLLKTSAYDKKNTKKATKIYKTSI